jgi:hypothetical protein
LTALNVFVRANAVHVLTDGLCRLEDGLFAGYAQKVRILGHLPAVISGCGNTEITKHFADRTNWKFASYDGAVQGMVETWSIAVDQFQENFPESRAFPCRIILAGWSLSRKRAECWGIDSTRNDSKQFPVMNYCTPTPPELKAELQKIGGDIASFDPVNDGLRIMRLQAKFKPETVGGFAQHTMVTKEGVGTRILERWPTK